MGSDKALLELNGKAFIQHVAEILHQRFDQVMVISDYDGCYEFLQIPIYHDVIKNCGPLGGIHSALHHSQTEKVFVAACDMPFLSVDVVDYLLESDCEMDVTVFQVNEVIQPLCGLYDKKCLPVLDEQLILRDFSVISFLEHCSTTIVTPEVHRVPNISDILTNINTRAEYDKYVNKSTGPIS